MSSTPASDSQSNSAYRLMMSRIDRITDPNHPLCREDVIWVLNNIKLRLIEHHDILLTLDREVLLRSYRYFAELSTLMLHRVPANGQESERLQRCIREASCLLRNPNEEEKEHK